MLWEIKTVWTIRNAMIKTEVTNWSYKLEVMVSSTHNTLGQGLSWPIGMQFSQQLYHSFTPDNLPFHVAMYFTHSKSTWELRKFTILKGFQFHCYLDSLTLPSFIPELIRSVYFLSCSYFLKMSLTSAIFASQYELWAGIILVAYMQDEGQTQQNNLPGAILETCLWPGSKL